MELVRDVSDIQVNIETINKYLQDQELKVFATGLIKFGICFIVVKTGQGYSFYPSRFIGYKNNSYNEHNHNQNKDGRKTNPAIENILQNKPIPMEEFEQEYKRFCRGLGFSANDKGSFGKERKYWLL